MPQKEAKVPEDLKEQKSQLHAIKALGDTEGGKALVSLLVEDTVSCIHKLLPNEDNTALVVKMHTNMELCGTILGAEANEEHLDELIKEALTA